LLLSLAFFSMACAMGHIMSALTGLCAKGKNPGAAREYREFVLQSGMLAAIVGLAVLAGCGGGSSSSGGSSGGGGTTPVANTVSVAVNSGPTGTAMNFLYVSVTVCYPNSTTSCTTINNVQVDTGSSGLRLLASALGSSVSLTPVAPSGSPVYECYAFADGSYAWGPVMLADVSFPEAGEKAASLPIQVINSPGSGVAVPSTCSQGLGRNRGTVAELQANGILGIGVTPQDCGAACAPPASPVPPYYWQCPSSGCSLSSLATALQVSNPVLFFSSDNNGVAIYLPSIPATGAPSVAGTLTFGIGTQADNALSSNAKVFMLSENAQGYNSIYATYNIGPFPAYVDSSDSFLFFLDATTVNAGLTGGASVTYCTQNYGLYCTSSPVTLPFTATDAFGSSEQVSLTIGDATTLLNSSVLNGGSNTAFSNLAGGLPSASDYVDLGLPFFYGKIVYIGIVNSAAPAGYYAF
jgi:hypothetical protein